MKLANQGKWLVLTAGLGGENFRAAAERVVRDASRFASVGLAKAVFEEDLPGVCPQTVSKYSDYLNPDHHGFGYFSWKPEIIFRGLEGYWGDFEGVIWIDAGCEVYATLFTEVRLRRWLKKCKKSGIFSFTLKTPENRFTKKDTFRLFSNLNDDDSSDQIQATWAIFHKFSILIAKEWLEKAQAGINYLDLSPSKSSEGRDFIEHRFDQSLLSLTLKSNRIRPTGLVPVAGKTGLKSVLRASIQPIWTTRNRSGASLIPSFLRLIQKKLP
jgi:hypothetical protein